MVCKSFCFGFVRNGFWGDFMLFCQFTVMSDMCHTHLHAHMHAHIHAHMCKHTHTCTHTHTQTHTYTHMHTHTHTHTHTYTHRQSQWGKWRLWKRWEVKSEAAFEQMHFDYFIYYKFPLWLQEKTRGMRLTPWIQQLIQTSPGQSRVGCACLASCISLFQHVWLFWDLVIENRSSHVKDWVSKHKGANCCATIPGHCHTQTF